MSCWAFQTAHPRQFSVVLSSKVLWSLTVAQSLDSHRADFHALFPEFCCVTACGSCVPMCWTCNYRMWINHLLAKALVMPSCIREKGKKCWWQCHYNAKNTNKWELSYDCDGATPQSHSRHKDKTHPLTQLQMPWHNTNALREWGQTHTHSIFVLAFSIANTEKYFSKPILRTTPLLNSLSYHIHAGNYYSVHLFFTSSVTLKIISSYWNDFIWQVSSELFVTACLPACGRQAVPLGHSGISGLLCRYW